jgi:uncharacterized protein (DUF1697 family)
MAEFRALLSDLKYANVATLLNSGNAVFHASKGTAAKHSADIAAAISSKLKVDVPVVVKSETELAAIIEENPITVEELDHSRFLVVFTQDPSTLASLSVIESLVVPPERFFVGKNAVYFLCASGILESKAGEALLGKVGKNVTTRNLATVLKLKVLANECAA